MYMNVLMNKILKKKKIENTHTEFNRFSLYFNAFTPNIVIIIIMIIITISQITVLLIQY